MHSPGTKSIELAGLGVEWSEEDRHLIDIDIIVSTEECSELLPRPSEKGMQLNRDN